MSQPRSPARRRWLLGASGLAGSAALAGWSWSRHAPPPIPGALLGADATLGHRLRTGDVPEPTQTLETDVLIVGGGISGLAAGLRLHDAGVSFLLAEMEDAVGGHSRAGANEISAYPWGAHYVPLPSEESVAVRHLFERLGVITGYDPAGLPVYDDYALCADPDERLLMHGQWQDGLLPQLGVSAEEHGEYRRFFDRMAAFKNLRGKDGRRAFAIPIDASSADPDLRTLDRISFRKWLDREGYRGEHLRWLLDYSCRDDYGAGLDEVSAWAGIHYFASRSGRAANAESDTVLTWPEGNGWLVDKLRAPIADRIRTRALAVRVQDGKRPATDLFLPDENRVLRVHARAVVLAVPRFVARRIVRSDRLGIDDRDFRYSPWLVANLTLDRLPAGPGAELAWDNVVYGSPMLGYVVATHQGLAMRPRRTVITWYWPLDHLPPPAAREQALARGAEAWKSLIHAEVLRLHPELEGAIRRIDLRLWGHAMIRPHPGFIWGEARRQALRQHPPIFFAHSDMAGISIFEEAYTYGVKAAEGVLDHLGARA
ncbi:MAG: NAD(P)-binding protein [Thiobacillus sp.]|nr:NAD(P)-binding protein [Thiobacillus sp.]